MRAAKRTTACVLVVLMAFMMMPPVALAATTYPVGDVASLTTALGSAADGDVIALTGSFSYPDSIVVDGIELTLDLGAFTLGANKGVTIHGDGGVLVVVGTTGKLNINSAAGHGLEVYDGGDVYIDGEGCEINVESWAPGSHGVYVHGGGSANVTSARSGNAAGLCGAYAADGGYVYVSGNARGYLTGAYAKDSYSYVYVGGNALGDTSHGAHAEGGGLVEVKGNAHGYFVGAQAAGSGSRVRVALNAKGMSTGAFAENGGIVTVGGDAEGTDTIGACAGGSGSRVSVTGKAKGGNWGVLADSGGSVVAGSAEGYRGAETYGDGNSIEIMGDVTGEERGVGATGNSAISVHGNVTVAGGIDGAVGAMASGAGSEIRIGGNLEVEGTGNCGAYIDGGGLLVIEGSLTADSATNYILLHDGPRSSGDAVPGTGIYEAYFAFADSNGNAVYLRSDAVCMIGTTWYPTLQDALDVALGASATTIRLLADIHYESGIVVEGITLVFDLNGHRLSIKPAQGHGIAVGPGGVVDMLDATGEGALIAAGGAALKEGEDFAHGVYAYGGGQAKVTAAVTDFDLLSESAGACAEGAGSKIDATDQIAGLFVGAHAVSGGTINAGFGTRALVGGGAFGVIAEGAGSKVQVNGIVVAGLFGGGVGAQAKGGGEVTVNGAILKSGLPGEVYILLGEDSEKSPSDGVKETRDGKSYLAFVEGTNAVYVTAACRIGDVWYPTLDDALDAVADGETITLLSDIEHTSEIVIEDKTITFELDGYTLTAISDERGAALEVTGAGAEVLLDDSAGGEFNVISYGEDEKDYCYGVYAHHGGKATVTNATAARMVGIAVSAVDTGSVVVKGDVTSVSYGVNAVRDSEITVFGNVTVDMGTGIAVVGPGAAVWVDGNVTISGEDARMAAWEGGTITIQGVLTAPEDTEIELYYETDGDDDGPVYKSLSDGVPGTGDNAGYTVYTDGVNLVRVRIQVTGAEIIPGSHAFAAASVGYGAQAAREFTVTNTGTTTITGLSAALGGADFEISAALSADSLKAGESATASVRPRTGLPAGSHTDTLTVTGSGGISLTVDLSFAVSAGGPGGSDPTYLYRTLTDPATGITVSGSGIHRAAGLSVTPMELHAAGSCAACDAIRAAQAQGQLILGYDISLTLPAAGTLTVSIPVGSQYNGQTVTILHCKGGALETLTATVSGGVATFTASSLSPFAVTGRVLSPKTGDAASPAGWAAMLGLAALCAGHLIARRRRV